MDLNTLSVADLSTMYSEGVEALGLDEKAKPFKNKAMAIKKINQVMLKHGLDVTENEGKLILIQKATGSGKLNGEEVSSDEVSSDETSSDETPSDEPSSHKKKRHTRKMKPEPKPEPEEDKKRKTRASTLNIAPRPADQIAPCRMWTNQAAVLDEMEKGSTLRAMTQHVNSVRKQRGLDAQISEQVVYGTIGYDVCKIKGYGVRVEMWNGEQLWEYGLYDDASLLNWGLDTHPDDTSDQARNEYRASVSNYDPEDRVAVYFVVLPEGMKAPLPHIEPPSKKSAKSES